MRHALIAVFLAATAGNAYAQETPAFDVSGGYSFLRDQSVEENFHGWVASATGNFSPLFGITGEIGGNYKTVQILGTDLNFSVHSYMAGPRFTARGSAGFTPFAQLLVGAARASGSVLGFSASGTEFAMQPGGGVDFWLQPNVGIRAGGDYRRIFAEEGADEFRFHFDIVLAGGSR
jgi:opacity protein-like surface antigen